MQTMYPLDFAPTKRKNCIRAYYYKYRGHVFYIGRPVSAIAGWVVFEHTFHLPKNKWQRRTEAINYCIDIINSQTNYHE